MINKIYIIFLFLYLTSCSVHDATGFWSKDKQLEQDNLQYKVLFEEKEINETEFNTEYQINVELTKNKINENSNFDNNDGFILYDGIFEDTSKFSFSKIKNFDKIENNLIFNNQNIIFFDNKGTIMCFDENSNLVWKLNLYTKDEKKLGPLLSLHKKNDILIVADNLARYYALDINTGDLLWEKRHTSPFNSEIKTLKNRIFILDANNTLNSFFINDGSKVWSHITEKSFINSSKRLSIAIDKDRIFFNNSLGDITAVEAKTGKLLWQTFTFKSNIYEELMSLKNSDIIINEGSLYFSNNKNEFYSLDSETGAINWIQDINSNLKPTVVNNLIFTFSNTGFQYIIEKKTGNILRINDVFYQFKNKKRNKIFPTGFVMSKNYAYIGTSIGRLLTLDWQKGRVENLIKIDSNNISRPSVNDNLMYLVKDNAVIRIN